MSSTVTAIKCNRRFIHPFIAFQDIACALRAHAICRYPERFESEHDTFCKADCRTSRSCKPNAAAMKRECLTYRRVHCRSDPPTPPPRLHLLL